jgi:hypothetical protein
MSDKNLSVLSVFVIGVGAGLALGVLLRPCFGTTTWWPMGCGTSRGKPADAADEAKSR